VCCTYVSGWRTAHPAHTWASAPPIGCLESDHPLPRLSWQSDLYWRRPVFLKAKISMQYGNTHDQLKARSWSGILVEYSHWTPIPVAARFKAWVCGRSPAEIVGSNPKGGMDVCCECCVLSGRGLCDELITLPGESYRAWCVVVCDLETLLMRRSCPTGGFRAKNKQNSHWTL